MDKPKAILLFDLCRLCLDNPGMDDMHTKTDIAQDIFHCTGVKITSQENLPRKICMQCLEIVIKAKRLRILATANDTYLKSLFDDNNETLIIQTNETDLTHNEEKAISRRSSTDSDRSLKLEIVEHDTEVKEKNQSNKRRSSNSSDHSKFKVKKISVRNDLFDSSAAVTSSTKDVTSTEWSSKAKIKTIKLEQDSSLNYVCEVCKKVFSAWKKFYLHQKTHNKNIICPLDTCGKKFAIKSDLEKHIRTHTGERPFRCEICDRSFAQRGTLKAHRVTVHADVVTTEEYIV